MRRDKPILCPQCRNPAARVGNFWICPVHGQIDTTLQPGESGQNCKPKLFLSYGRQDAAKLADRLAFDLEAQGFEVWIDRTIQAGRDWQKQIVDGLRSTQILIALLSPHAVRVSADPGNPDALDSVCLDEISFARFSQPPKPIIPVMVAPCEPPLCIFRLDYVDLVAWEESQDQYQAGLERLLQAITDALEGKTHYRSWDPKLKPWDFAAFLFEKRRDFVGRQWLFEEIHTWLAQTGEPSLLITGDPGTGKSAIVAELVHHNRGGQVLAYHCCMADTPETLSPARFVRSLAAMIASQLRGYGAQLEDPALQEALSETSCARDPASALEAGIFNPLEALPAPEGGVRYILIDALDEALATRQEGLTIVEVLACRLNRLPGWLRLVATTRKEPKVLDQLRSLRARELDAQDPRNLTDLQAYLDSRLDSGELGRLRNGAGLSRESALQILVDKSAGNFLYVRQALEGLERGLYDFSHLDRLPPGLNSLYLQFFRRQFPDEGSYEPVRCILQVVTAAQEPLEGSQLSQAAGLDPEEELPRLLRRLSVYLPSREGSYSFFHKSLSDWLTDSERRGADYAINPRRGHNALADLGWQGYLQGVRQLPRYMLAHLPRHLAEAGRQEDLRGLLLDPHWMKAKLAALGIMALIADYDILCFASDLQLIKGALCLSSQVVESDPSQLAGQLFGRLLGFEEIEVQSFLKELGKSEHRSYLRPLARSLISPGGPLLRTLTGHTDRVTAVALSSDGRIMVSASNDHTLKVWNLEAGAELHTLTGHTRHVKAVALTPDGRSAVSASIDTTLKVWDLETGQERCTLRGHHGFVLSVALSGDGRYAVSGSSDKTLKLWDLESGQERCTLTGHQGDVNAVALNGDGRSAVSASSDRTLKFWDLEIGKERFTLTGHSGGVCAVALSRGGRYAVSGSLDHTLKVWDLKRRQEVNTFTGHTDSVQAVALTEDHGRLVSGSMDHTLKVWDLAKGINVCTLTGHTRSIRAIALSEDGRYAVSGSSDRTLKIWDLDRWQESQIFTGHTDWVYDVAVAGDSRSAVSASDDRTVKVWNLENGEEHRTFIGHTDKVRAVTLTADGGFAVSASDDRTLKVWNLKSGQAHFTLTGHTGKVRALALTRDGHYAVSGSHDNNLRVWDLRTGQDCHALIGHTHWVNAIALSGDGHYAASGSYDHTMKIWDLETGQGLVTFTGHAGPITAVVLSDDGLLAVSASSDHTLKVWNLKTGEERRTLTGHTDFIHAVAMSGDGRIAVSASDDHTLKVWELEPGEERYTLTGHTHWIRAVRLTMDGHYAVSASYDGTLKLWDLERATCLATFTGEGAMTACALAPDGSILVAGDASGRVHCLRLTGVSPGPPHVTVWRWRGSLALGCILCRRWWRVAETVLGMQLLCPHCGKTLKINPFTIEADWRNIARAWGKKMPYD